MGSARFYDEESLKNILGMTFALLRVFLIDSSDQAKDLFQVLDFGKGLASFSDHIVLTAQ